MRILIIHNHYGHFAVGGEAAVVRAEAELLRGRGHEVELLEATNSELDDLPVTEKFRAVREIGWSSRGYQNARAVVERFRPAVVHVHNYWLRLTPSVFAAAKDGGAATVFTLHNYRLLCPGNEFLHNGKICERCMDGWGWRVLWHRCYPDRSLAKSALSLRLYLATRKRGLLQRWVDLYVTLSEFARGKLSGAGISAGRVVVQPNFLPDPANPGVCPAPGYGALFVGRASREKGLLTLVAAWRGIEYPLTVVGSGPDLQRAQAASPPQVTFTGEIPHDAVLDQMRRSAMLVMPSECYEGLPMVLIEAMALARPVVSSDLEPRREVVVNGETGLLYRPGDASDLRDKVRTLIADPARCVRMGAAARQRYLELYTAERHYETLIGIYGRALRIAKEREAATVVRREPGECVE